VNHNARFTNATGCTLTLKGSTDGTSGSGLALMRRANKRFICPLADASFPSDTQAWTTSRTFTWHSPGYGELPMVADSILHLQQDIAADSFNTYVGDYYRLSADIVSDSLGSSGVLAFKYRYSKQDTHVSGPSLVCSTGVSVSIPEGYASKVGTNHLTGKFRLWPTAPQG